MATCPSCATTLTQLPNTGAGAYLVCTGCKNHYFGTGGILIRSHYSAGGRATIITTSAQTVTVSHGLYVTPSDGDLIAIPASAQLSGANYYVSATSSLNFVITTDVIGALTSGVAFIWQYNRS